MTLPEENNHKIYINLLLEQLGVTANYIGYHYTACAVKLAIENPQKLTRVTKLLYPEVAKIYGTNWKAVERNIRTVVAIAWESNPALMRKLSCNHIEKKPCASQFLSILMFHTVQVFHNTDLTATLGFSPIDLFGTAAGK